jgi:hypothetical protein
MTTTGEPTPLRSFMSPFSAWLSGCFSGLFPVSEKTKKKEKKKGRNQTDLAIGPDEGGQNFSVTQARADDNHERSTRPHS